jgi:hypothetical protein
MGPSDSLPLKDSFCDLSETGSGNMLAQFSSVFSFLNVVDIDSALKEADWTVKKEIKELIDVINDPETKAKYKLQAMREVRGIAITSMKEAQILTSATLRKTQKMDSEGNILTTTEQTVTIPVQQLRTQTMLVHNEQERSFRNQINNIRNPESEYVSPTPQVPEQKGTENEQRPNDGNENNPCHNDAGEPEPSSSRPVGSGSSGAEHPSGTGLQGNGNLPTKHNTGENPSSTESNTAAAVPTNTPKRGGFAFD